jgi:hypothetical protein
MNLHLYSLYNVFFYFSFVFYVFLLFFLKFRARGAPKKEKLKRGTPQGQAFPSSASALGRCYLFLFVLYLLFIPLFLFVIDDSSLFSLLYIHCVCYCLLLF